MMRFLTAAGVSAAILVSPSLSSAAEANAPRAEVQDYRAVEAEIAARVNAYRASRGLSPVPVSPSLQAVAQAHASDLFENRPDRGVDARGVACTMHSWSTEGRWNGGCYPEDNWEIGLMWKKPAEITGGAYPGYGFEIAFGGEGTFVTPDNALEGWKGSPSHNAILIEGDSFEGSNWQAMGVGYRPGWAVVWFGKQKDESSPAAPTLSAKVTEEDVVDARLTRLFAGP